MIKLKFVALFFLIDLSLSLLISAIQAQTYQISLIKLFAFVLLVRILILSLILVFWIIINKVLKKESNRLIVNFFLGYVVLNVIYLNENGWNHWINTLIKINFSWEIFSQIILPYCLAFFIVCFLRFRSEISNRGII